MATTERYWAGTRVTIYGDLEEIAGHAPVDGLVHAALLLPGAAEWAEVDGADITQIATGQWKTRVLADVPGTWRYKWWTTDDPETALEGAFEVRETAFPPAP